MSTPFPPKRSAPQSVRSFLALLFFLVFSFWFGGLFTLGAIVAPIVFRRVPAPYSADSMTEVFRRFDRVALLFAGLLLLVEGARFMARPTGDAAPRDLLEKPDLVRIAALVLASASRAAMGFHFSPKIEALHRAGAIRGSGELGLALEEAHRTAERLAKVESFFLLIAAVAMILSLHPRPRPPPP